MVTNRVFICHVVRSEKPEEKQILLYLKEAFRKTGIEIVIHKNDDTEESFFQQLREELPTCQSFLLLQTPDAIYAPRVHLAVKAAKQLFDQKKLPGFFRFICPSAKEATIPKEWKGLTTFDGTHDYQRAIARLVLNISAKSKNDSSIALAALAQTAKTGAVSPSPLVEGEEPASTPSSQTSSVNSVNTNIIPLIPLDAIPTTAMSVLDPASITDKPSQTAFTSSINSSAPIEIVSTSTPRPANSVSIADKPSPINFIDSTSSNRSLEIAPTSALPVLRRTSLPQTPVRLNYDKPPKPSLWKRLKERRKLLTGIAIALVILTLIGSAGTLFFLNATSPQPLTAVAAPPPNPTIGQVSFFGSDQIDATNSTGITDEIQANLTKLTSPTAGHSYYAWLLPNPGNSIEGRNIALGTVTINKGAASLTFANPTHENLLLTESTFLITEESSNPSPSIPSPDQRVWRYIGIIPQTPSPLDPNHASNLDHVRHLLASDPLLQDIGLQGGLGTWFYENVQKVLEWANAAKGTGEQQGFDTVHRNLVRILDVLDGTNNVAGDVPKGTPIVVEPPEIARIPLLTLDSVHQNPTGYIDHLETHLQGLTASPDATDTERTIATQIDNELVKIEPLLKKVREDAKQLVNLSLKDLANPNNAPIFTDMVDNANAAFIGELDPATNKRQGGTTFIHDILPQIATIDVKAFTSL